MTPEPKKTLQAENNLQTETEKAARKHLVELFETSKYPVEVKLDNFPKYIRRQKMTRLLTLYEIFKKVLHVKGSVIECGVFHGFGLMSWAHFSAVLEPNNIMRKIYGFDSFTGFPSVSAADKNLVRTPGVGDLSSSSFDELQELVKLYDTNRFLGHIPKIELVKGDIAETIPEFIKTHQHVVVSLLFLDLDLFEPTKIAIEHFVPRMPKGAIIAFDELDNPMWPGETRAALEKIGINNLRIQRLEFDPYIGFATIE